MFTGDFPSFHSFYVTQHTIIATGIVIIQEAFEFGEKNQRKVTKIISGLE